ncbi:MAG: ribonuclease Y [Patescibacteria group bacterium]|jgi:ribonuclease Y
MEFSILWFAILAASLAGGVLAGYWFRKTWAIREAQSIEAKAQTLIEKAKAESKEHLLDAKEKASKVIEEAQREEKELRAELRNQQQRLEQRESKFDSKLMEVEGKQEELAKKATKLEELKGKIREIQEMQEKRLEEIASLSREEATEKLMIKVEESSKEALTSRLKKMDQESSDVIDKKARDLLSTAIQRVVHSHVTETTTTVVQLPSEDMKGRIIGREGRNIKALETLTGVEIVVDDTPDTIVISGFNPIRRHLAKRALEKLMSDGRIHPARIEETVKEAKKDLTRDIQKAGEDAVYDVGVTGLNPQLVQVLGRLKYRTSYGQNVLLHSIEVALLSGLIAAQLGADSAKAKKAGLLHDIGKAINHEVGGAHTTVGYEILKKFGVSEDIAQVAVGHHEDHVEDLTTIIVKTADAISGGRPGARKDTYENYVQRLDEIETLAKNFEGVEKVYAIQAGREVRVFVEPTKIDDWKAHELAKDIAKSIEQQLQYPGEIKVNVIRETRAIEYAR